jgi:lipopolysaccharide transport system ATP-binding protein
MAPTAALEVANLGKQYQVAGTGPAYHTLRDRLVDGARAWLGRLRDGRPPDPAATASFWALRGLSFAVQPGEAFGIIGRNGAGKSTLLKILARIVTPTTGQATLQGRVSSLLEVGTGFHPELTGRENVYLNGAILGMRRAEIQAKFDEIIEFAEVSRFVDTPLKHYSTGMFARLAFAVAAHLSADILLVDEVLAVGDLVFQRRCLSKMGDVARGGRTVLFVSHNMAAITRLCQRALWLDSGELKDLGPVGEVVSKYVTFGAESAGERRWEPAGAPGGSWLRLRAIRVLNDRGAVAATVESHLPFHVEIEYDIPEELAGLQVGFWLLDGDGVTVFVAGDNVDPAYTGRPRAAGRYASRCTVPARLLNGGLYALTVAADLRNSELILKVESALTFMVELTDVPIHSPTRPAGIICPFLDWRIERQG